MECRAPIHISIYNFMMFGKFDSIEIGQTKEWILNNFPNPDDRIVQKRGQGFDIWRYGTIEFHFVGEELVLIFSDSIGERPKSFRTFSLPEPAASGRVRRTPRTDTGT